MTHDVFISGVGAVTPFGVGTGALWDGIWSGRVAIQPITRFASRVGSVAFAAEFPPEAIVAAGGSADLAFGTARLAAEEALSGMTRSDRRTTGLVLATTKAELSGFEGPGVGFGSPGRLLARLWAALDLGGPVCTTSAACSSGIVALGTASRWVASGRCTRVLVVGVDILWEFVLRGFEALMAMDPEPCRPYDRSRRGMSCGEAAAAVLLTAEENTADAFRMLGWGASTEGHHMTGPRRDGFGVRTAAERALGVAGIVAASVSFVHLHGTGTPFNDAAEATGLSDLFAPAPKTPPAFGSKGQLGHAMGASSLIESLVALEALRRGTMPGNAGLLVTDVDPRLDVAPNPRRLPSAEYALKVSAGFGGVCAATVFAR